MKAKTLGLLSLAGMLFTSVSVYSLTPPGGAFQSWGHGATAETDPRPAGSEDVVASQNELAHFTSGSTLMVEGRLGNAKMVKNARGETFVMLEVKGEGGEGVKAAPQVNLAIVIDRSGSMRGSRLSNAMNAAVAAVDRLRDGDVVSVVTFDTRTQIVVPPQTIGAGARQRIAADRRGKPHGG